LPVTEGEGETEKTLESATLFSLPLAAPPLLLNDKIVNNIRVEGFETGRPEYLSTNGTAGPQYSIPVGSLHP